MLILERKSPFYHVMFLKRFFSIQTWLRILKQSKDSFSSDLLNIVWGYLPLFTSGDRMLKHMTD